MLDGHKCSMCKNFLGRKGELGPYRCKCFPGGIPQGIMLDEYDSRCKRDPGKSTEYYDKIYSKKPKDTIPTTQDPEADIKTDLKTGHLEDI